MQTRNIAAAAGLAALIATSAFSEEKAPSLQTALSSTTFGGYVDTPGKWPAESSLSPLLVPIAPGYGGAIVTWSLGASGTRIEDALRDGLMTYPKAYPEIEPPSDIIRRHPVDAYGSPGTTFPLSPAVIEPFTPSSVVRAATGPGVSPQALRESLTLLLPNTPSPTAVPEPSTLVLGILGVGVVMFYRQYAGRYFRGK